MEHTVAFGKKYSQSYKRYKNREIYPVSDDTFVVDQNAYSEQTSTVLEDAVIVDQNMNPTISRTGYAEQKGKMKTQNNYKPKLLFCYYFRPKSRPYKFH